MANMFDMLKQAGQMRKQAAQMQKMLLSIVCEESSSDGKVKVKVNGKMELLSIDIAEELLSAEQKRSLEKILLKTWQAAQKRVEGMIQEEMRKHLGDLPINLPF